VKAFIGLGGNADDSRRLLAAAVERLAATSGLTVLQVSRIYRSAPWGMKDQPDFVNAVAQVESDLRPEALLGILQQTEQALGRIRKGPRWGPRSIDLDLLTCDDTELETDRLRLPHPRMHERAFVLVPLLELEPSFRIPGRGSAQACLRRLDVAETESVTPLEETETED
jgi:2-amino-4-hydroxy-6-hydroxymethyldihydropteridine diphosphokinase